MDKETNELINKYLKNIGKQQDYIQSYKNKQEKIKDEIKYIDRKINDLQKENSQQIKIGKYDKNAIRFVEETYTVVYDTETRIVKEHGNYNYLMEISKDVLISELEKQKEEYCSLLIKNEEDFIKELKKGI